MNRPGQAAALCLPPHQGKLQENPRGSKADEECFAQRAKVYAHAGKEAKKKRRKSTDEEIKELRALRGEKRRIQLLHNNL